MKKVQPIRCDICGKFMGFKEWQKGEVDIKYIPDTHHSNEETIFTHKKCLIKKEKK